MNIFVLILLWQHILHLCTLFLVQGGKWSLQDARCNNKDRSSTVIQMIKKCSYKTIPFFLNVKLLRIPSIIQPSSSTSKIIKDESNLNVKLKSLLYARVRVCEAPVYLKTNTTCRWLVILCLWDFRLPPRCRWDPRFSRILSSLKW